MDEQTLERETAINRSGWERIREQVRRDYDGQYVALAHGRIVAATPDFHETLAAVRRMDPVPEYFLVFSADDEPAFEPIYNYNY